MHILEAHRSQGPIIFDIDIKYSADTNGRKYTYDHILKTVEVYNSVINKYLNVDDEYKHCFITEKKRPNKVHDGVYKDGFHGEYPNICASNQLQHLIRIEVIKKFIENDYYKDINYTNKYEDIFDAAIIENNGWFVYGCCKPKREPYILTHILDGKLNDCDKKKFNIKNLPQILSIRNFGKEDKTKYNSNFDDEIIKKEFLKLNIKKENINK